MDERSFRMDELMPLMRESLAAGKSFRFSPRGISMLPMLRQGKDSVILSPVTGKLKKYDIPLYQRDDGAYVLHRITKVEDTYTCIGDNQYDYEPGIRQDQIIAVLTSFYRGEKEISADALSYRIYSRLWHWSRPVRKLLMRAKRKSRVILRKLGHTYAKGGDVPMWKKLLLPAGLGILLLALILCLSFCSGEEKAPEKPVVGICMHDLASEQEALCARELQAKLEEKGFDVQILDAGNDQSVQNKQVQQLLGRNCKGIVLCPVMPDGVTEVVKSAKSKDVPIVFFHAEPSKQIMDLWEKTGYVGCDPSQSGREQGELLLRLPNNGDINGDGVVAYILLQDDDQCADTRKRSEALRQEIAAGAETEELNCTVAGTTQTAAEESFEKLLANYGKDVEVVICTNDTVALGTQKAIEDGGRTVGVDIYLIGAEGADEAIGKIVNGELSGTVYCDIRTQAKEIFTMIEKLNHPETAEKRILVDHVIVVKENAEVYLKKDN